MSGELFPALATIRACPACARKLKWNEVRVHGADGVRMPDEDWYYADCPCGLHLTWRSVAGGDEDDEPE